MSDLAPAASPSLVAAASARRGESRWWIVARTAFPFLVVALLWELTAHLGIFPRKLFPPLEEVAAAFVRLTAAGILPHHVLDTLLRLLAGFGLAALAGVAIGFAMGRSRRADPGPRLRPAVPALVRAGQFFGRAVGGLRLRLPDHLQHLDRGEGGEGDLAALRPGHGRRQPAPPSPRDPSRRAPLRADRAAARAGAGLAHSRGCRDAGGGALGTRLDDLRRARVPEHRRDARRRRRDRRDRARAREARVPAARELHRRALGDDDVTAAANATTNSANMDRARSAYRAGLTLLLAAALYEAIARSGAFPPALLPTLPKVASTLWSLTLDGTMLEHAGYTMYRVLFGLALAIAVGLPLGILMGRIRQVENFFLPLASALMPIPSLAWVPVFILWFGLGNTVAILIVFYAALFPMLLNTWSGVRAVNPLWLRAAGAMGADERALFWKVIIPGASPFIITGLRQAFLRSWAPRCSPPPTGAWAGSFSTPRNS